MTSARKNVVRENEDATYHCITRCVRRAYLCGRDSSSNKNFEHRKEWIRERIQFLLTIFNIEVIAYAVLCNHLHLLLRTLHLVAQELTDEDIARRWLRLYPKHRNLDGSPTEPSSIEIETLTRDPERIRTLRHRLASLSWFMKSLNENIARRANKEDGCKGRFWEGRFRCQRLEGTASMLSCAIYIDLNPIRAKAADLPEESQYTSAWERIHAKAARAELSVLAEVEKERSSEALSELQKRSIMDDWLTPMHSNARNNYLQIDLPDYLSLLDWTGREIRADKRGAIPSHISPILERVQINPTMWIDSAENFGNWFCKVAGNAASMEKAAKSLGRAWLKGVRVSRDYFQ